MHVLPTRTQCRIIVACSTARFTTTLEASEIATICTLTVVEVALRLVQELRRVLLKRRECSVHSALAKVGAFSSTCASHLSIYLSSISLLTNSHSLTKKFTQHAWDNRNDQSWRKHRHSSQEDHHVQSALSTRPCLSNLFICTHAFHVLPRTYDLFEAQHNQ